MGHFQYRMILERNEGPRGRISRECEPSPSSSSSSICGSLSHLWIKTKQVNTTQNSKLTTRFSQSIPLKFQNRALLCLSASHHRNSDTWSSVLPAASSSSRPTEPPLRRVARSDSVGLGMLLPPVGEEVANRPQPLCCCCLGGGGGGKDESSAGGKLRSLFCQNSLNSLPEGPTS